MAVVESCGENSSDIPRLTSVGDEIKKSVRTVLISEKQNLPCSQFEAAFNKSTNTSVPWKEHGFKDLVQFLLSMPDAITVMRLFSLRIYCTNKLKLVICIYSSSP
jgi:hypothetical protein